MTSRSESLVVFTGKSVESILRDGGTNWWRVDRNRARNCEFVLCTRNTKTEWSEGSEDHHSGFLVGRVSGVIPETNARGEDRFQIQLSEYASVNIPDAWKGDRNPVKYVPSLEDYGVDPAELDWQPMPPPTANGGARPNGHPPGDDSPLTIAEAKRRLALTFGVLPDAIEITIRG
ncbi:MAG: hypothetical protein JWL65_1985 [Gammaproteobacteria bacterium]|nr:hypothetical protein [Gammaproteobacteria bacterium]